VPELPNVVTWAIPAFVLLVVIEVVSYYVHPDEDEVGYEVKDTFASLAMGLGSVFLDLLWKVPIVAVYVAVYELTPLRVPVLWWTVLLVLLAQDFCYYWSHRSHHVVRLLWASHVVHHSSRRFNLSTALRQPWTGVTSAVFYLPLIVLGVSPAQVFFVQSINLVYQFWIHTERIDKMWRWFEYVCNTPSHHRVHHAANGSYLDRNFAGILITWDRLFGTFEAEGIRCQYGLTKNIATYNPLRVAFHEYASIARDLAGARTWRERVGYSFAGPGWAAAKANGQANGQSSAHAAPEMAGAGAGPSTDPGHRD
jgi:sterol desaturase/sphingolipid hydroxylase (fatty acid hydroxylase superfamily)